MPFSSRKIRENIERFVWTITAKSFDLLIGGFRYPNCTGRCERHAAGMQSTRVNAGFDWGWNQIQRVETVRSLIQQVVDRRHSQTVQVLEQQKVLAEWAVDRLGEDRGFSRWSIDCCSSRILLITWWTWVCMTGRSLRNNDNNERNRHDGHISTTLNLSKWPYSTILTL